MKPLLVSLILLGGCIPNYSDGNRAGQIIKLSQKGVFNKTWEGEMVLGGFHNVQDKDGNTTGIAANTWKFTVCNEQLVPTILALQDKGNRVTVHYTQEFFVAPWRRDSSYCLDRIVDVNG